MTWIPTAGGPCPAEVADVDRGVDVALVLRAAARALPATNGQPLAAGWAGQGASGAAVVGGLARDGAHDGLGV